jgi:predicted enzyme related to lactoylglutathione lyase
MAALSREADKAPVFVRSFADADQDSPMSLEAPQMIGQWVEGRAPAADAGMMLWINVSDLDHVIELTLANGGDVLEPPAADGPTRMLATIRDPGGNPIGLAAHSHGSRDVGHDRIGGP